MNLKSELQNIEMFVKIIKILTEVVDGQIANLSNPSKKGNETKAGQ